MCLTEDFVESWLRMLIFSRLSTVAFLSGVQSKNTHIRNKLTFIISLRIYQYPERKIELNPGNPPFA